MPVPTVTGLKMNIVEKTLAGMLVSAEYFLVKDLMIVGVVMSSMVFECIIFWNMPESWSA